MSCSFDNPHPPKNLTKNDYVYDILVLHINFADYRNNPHHLCLAVYYLPENFRPKPMPHGNSRDNKPFFTMLPSTMAAIKSESKHSGPKQVIEKISSSMGGVLSATDVSVTTK